MKGRRGRPSIVFAFVVLTAGLAAPPGLVTAQEFDWGVSSDSSTNLRDDPRRDDAELQQLLRVSLWVELHGEFRDDRTIRFTTEGGYRFEYDQDEDEDTLHILNLDTLRLRAGFPLLLGPGSSLDVTAGRFRFRDPTGRIWNHTADGASFELRFPRWWLQGAGAYTGLLLNEVSDIRMTPTDSDEQSDSDQYFGPQRAIGLVRVRLPELIERQSLTAFALLQFDLRDRDDDEETLNTQYYGLQLDGPVEPVRGLYYDVFGAAALGRLEEEGGGESDITAGLYGARLRYFRERLRFSRILLEWLHASGSREQEFVAINAPSTGFAFSPTLSNLMIATLGYSLRPFSTAASPALAAVQTGLTARSFMRSSVETGAAAVMPEATDAADDSRYLGTELELRLAVRPTSELGLVFTNAVFFPNDDAFLESDRWYRGRFELSLGF